jgi:hypothetical protein
MNPELRKLVADLEAARLGHLHKLVGCDVASSAGGIRILADLQMALIAAREVLAAHEPSLGHGSETPV